MKWIQETLAAFREPTGQDWINAAVIVIVLFLALTAISFLIS